MKTTKHDLATSLKEALEIIDFMRAGDGSLPLLADTKLVRAKEALAMHEAGKDWWTA